MKNETKRAQKLNDEQLTQTTGGFDSCQYAGLEYSHGSRLEMAGKVMECRQGSWFEV